MKRSDNVALRATFLSLLVSAASGVFAQAPEGQQPAPAHHAPPPEALAACKSASSGQECSFTSAGGETINGKCRAHEGKPLACRPPHPPGGKPPASQPPQ
jgi:hypothetical protein